MKIIKTTLGQLRSTSLTPGAYGLGEILIQGNNRYDFLHIGSAGLNNLLLRIWFGSTDSNEWIHVRPGSTISLRDASGERANDVRVTINPQNYPESDAYVAGVGGYMSTAGALATPYDDNLPVEFMLLDRIEAAHYVVGRIRPGDIIYSGGRDPSALTGAPVTETLLQSNYLEAFHGIPMSLRAILHGGWVADSVGACWFVIRNQFGSDTADFDDAYPMPGIGRAILSCPLIDFAPRNTAGYHNQLLLGYPAGNDLDETAGWPAIRFEIVAGHLPRRFHYRCFYHSDSADENDNNSFYYRRGPDNASTTTLHVHNKSTAGTWRWSQLAISPHPITDVYYGTTLNIDTAAAAVSRSALTDNHAEYGAVWGKFTAAPTDPDIYTSFRVAAQT